MSIAEVNPKIVDRFSSRANCHDGPVHFSIALHNGAFVSSRCHLRFLIFLSLQSGGGRASCGGRNFLDALPCALARPTLICAFGALHRLPDSRAHSPGDDLLHALKPVTDATLAKLAAHDWLMRRGDFARGALARSIKSRSEMSAG